jgi:hypothetical protein
MRKLSAMVVAAIAALALVLAPIAAFATPGVNVTVTAGVNGDYTGLAGIAAQDAHLATRRDLTFLTGSAANQAGKVYTESVSIAASSSESDDLTTATDALGATLGLTAVKAVFFLADTTNTNSVVFGNAASNGWSAPFDAATDTISVPPGGELVLMNPTAGGWTVDSSHKLLKIANSSSGTAVTGRLIIIGQ